MAMKTPFDEAACPTPSPAGNHQGTSGGFDLPGGQKETEGGVLPAQPTLTSIQGEGGSAGNVGGGKTIDTFDGTFKPGK